MKKILFTLIMLIATLSLHAHDFEVDGIYYNYLDKTTKTIEVTSGSTKYTGSVIIPSSVTYGGVTYSVTSIGGLAFYYCTGLTSVTIPNSVTKIGYNAFRGSGLTSVTIPNSVTSIGDDAFYYCTGLTSVTISNSVTSIGNDAFANCTGLTSVTIPNSVTSIGNSAFSGCTGLTEVTIPNSVTSIGVYAFEDCSGLTEVTIPNSVTSIGSGTFQSCSGLTEVTIPNSVTSIGDYAFFNCSGLTEVTIPNSVTSIGSLAFCECTGLTSVTIPNSVTSIGDKAFRRCSSLTEVTIPNSVTSIDTETFVGCTGLTSVTIPNSVTSIGKSAFSGCTGLTSVTIPNSVTEIGESAFARCTGLTEVTIPNSVTEIGESAFYRCSSLTSVTVPNSVTSIGKSAFYGTPWRENHADGVIYIGKVLYEYKGIMPKNTTINIKEGIVSISPYAFANCTGLTEVTIPNSVTEIGEHAFDGCTGLTSIDYNAENCTSIDSSFLKGYTGTFKIGDNVKSIPAFILCRADVSAIEMGSSVEKIGRCAFRFCNRLSTVSLPATIKEIDYYAFESCDSLVSIVSLSPTPPTMITAQLTNDYTPTLYVPQGSYELYKNDWHWGDFENIVELVETEDRNTTFAMPQVTDAVAYTVNVYADEAKTQLVATADLDAEETATSKLKPLHLSIDGFENGRYYYDVMAQFATGKTLRNHFGSFAVGNNGIDNIETDSDAIEIARYDIHGRLLSAPTPGINIVKYSDGTTRKECVK